MFRIANSVHFTRFSTKNSRCSLIRECSVFTSRSHGLIKISNLPASRGLSKFSSARASSHEQGKAAFVDALRSSFVVAAKNTRSESRRQDEAFINAFEDPSTRPLMTSAVIEDSFWTLLEEGENMRIVKAVAHLPHDLCSNSSLNATLLAFGRMNRPSKGLDLLFKYLKSRRKNGPGCGVAFDKPAAALSLEYALQSFCEADRLDQVEEIIAQWVHLASTSRLEKLKLDSDLELRSSNEEKEVLKRRKEVLTSELDCLTAMTPAFIERVNANRKATADAMKKAAEAAAKEEEAGEGGGELSEGKESAEEVKKIYKYGEELDVHTLFDLKEHHAFERNVYWSKEQAYAEYNQHTDSFKWEQTLDEESSLKPFDSKEHSLEEPSKDSDFLLSDVFHFEDKASKGKTRVDTSGDVFVIPFPTANMMCLLTKLYASRGAWDSCLRICQAMVLQEVDKRALMNGIKSVSEQGQERAAGQEGGGEEVFRNYIETVSSPLNVCYRHTITALCNNGQYDAAFQLTNTVKPLGVVVTPSSLALLLQSFEVNEDLSRVDMTGVEGGMVTLIDFQEEILKTCIMCGAFEKQIHDTLHNSHVGEGEGEGGVANSDSSTVLSSAGEERGYSSSSSGCERMWQRHHTKETLENAFDQCSTGTLILTNVRLLCERGMVFAAEKMLSDLGAAGAADSIPLEAVALLAHHLSTRRFFEKSIAMYKYLLERNKVYTDLELSGAYKGYRTGAQKGLALEALRNRRVDLTTKILPDLFNSICNEYRALNDLTAMLSFIKECGPKLEYIVEKTKSRKEERSPKEEQSS